MSKSRNFLLLTEMFIFVMIITIFMKDLMKTKAYKNLRNIMLQWGFSNTEASIYALLALSEKPLGAKKIAERINRAYSSVVNELNKLIRAGLVERTKGERCYEYSAVLDLIGIIRMERKRLISMLSEINKCLKEIDGNVRRELINHLEEALDYLGRLEKEV